MRLKNLAMGMMLILLTISSSFAEVDRSKLRPGDLVLIGLNCYLCDLIKAEEQSDYSHVGILLENIHGEWIVAEAFAPMVTVTSLTLFTFRKHDKIKFLRFKKEIDVDLMRKKFFTEFMSLKYDTDFLWDNVDENKNEKLYCSELVYKLFQDQIEGLPLKRMHFNQNREAWERYFRGSVPDNEWGVSPADFERSDLLTEVL